MHVMEFSKIVCKPHKAINEHKIKYTDFSLLAWSWA